MFVGARLTSTHTRARTAERAPCYFSLAVVSCFIPLPPLPMLTSHISETLLFPTCPYAQASQTLAFSFSQKSYFRSSFRSLALQPCERAAQCCGSYCEGFKRILRSYYRQTQILRATLCTSKDRFNKVLKKKKTYIYVRFNRDTPS